MRTSTVNQFLLVPLLALSLAASANEKLADIEVITVLPVLLSENLNIESPAELHDNVTKMLLRELALKGYVLDKPRNWTVPESWSAERVREQPYAELTKDLPERAEHVALLFVEDLKESSIVVASKAETRIAAVIVESKTGAVIWEKQSEGSYKENLNLFTGFVHMMITPDKYFALEKAFKTLFEEFPEKPF